MSSSDGGDRAVQSGKSAQRRRRSYSEDEKLRLVAERCEPGASVSGVAQRRRPRSGRRERQRSGAEGDDMIAPGPGVRVYLATQPCDKRKGMDGLAAQVRNVLAADPFSGALFVFRGKRGDIVKILASDGSALILFAKRLGQGK